MNLFSNEVILYKKQSPFNDITVTQRGDLVTLWSPETIKQSEVNLLQPLQPKLEYNGSMVMCLAFCPEPSAILGLGLGGGVIPSIFHAVCPHAFVDVVEIDEEMNHVAEHYFQFHPSPKLRVIIQDAYIYMTQKTETDRIYDIIFMDTYLGNTLPMPLKTMKFFEGCIERLSQTGIFAANLMSGDATHLKKILRRLSRIFDSLWLLPGVFTGNVVVFGRKTEITEKTLLENALSIPQKFPFPFNAVQLAVRIKKRNKVAE